MKPWEREGETVTRGPLREYRHVETWWWIKPGDGPPEQAIGVGDREDLARRAQRIYGGKVEVIRQAIRTETTVSEVGRP